MRGADSIPRTGWVHRVVFAIVVAAPAAWAQSTAPSGVSTTARIDDTIVLRDGSTIVGEVVVIRPLRSVVVMLANGESRTIAWAEIRAMTGPSFPIGSPATGAPLERAVELPSPPHASANVGELLPPVPIHATETAASLAADLEHPAPGRVPLRIESLRGQLSVSVFDLTRTNIPVADPTPVCTVRPPGTTPAAGCTLHVPPGLVRVRLDSRTAWRRHDVDVRVSPTGQLVRVRTPRYGLEALSYELATIGGLGSHLGLAVYIAGMLSSGPSGHDALIGGGAAGFFVGAGLLFGAIVAIRANVGSYSTRPLRADELTR